jgi:hypothetical protein
MDAITNFRFIQQLPLVQELIAKNRKLKKRNKELKNLVRLISGNLPLFETKKSKKDTKEVIDISNEDDEHIVMTVEDVKVKVEEPIVVVEQVKVKVERTVVVKDEPIVVVEEEQEEVEEEQEEVEEEQEEVEEEQEEVEEEQEEETEEVFEVIIKGKTYYTTDEKNGVIYAVESSGDIGDEVGRFTAGVAVFA